MASARPFNTAGYDALLTRPGTTPFNTAWDKPHASLRHCGEQKKSHFRPSDEMSMKNVYKDAVIASDTKKAFFVTRCMKFLDSVDVR